MSATDSPSQESLILFNFPFLASHLRIILLHFNICAPSEIGGPIFRRIPRPLKPVVPFPNSRTGERASPVSTDLEAEPAALGSIVALKKLRLFDD